MAEILIRDIDEAIVEKLRKRAISNGKSLQAELKSILETQARRPSKSESDALVAQIRLGTVSCPHSDSGDLQSEDRER